MKTYWRSMFYNVLKGAAIGLIATAVLLFFIFLRGQMAFNIQGWQTRILLLILYGSVIGALIGFGSTRPKSEGGFSKWEIILIALILAVTISLLFYLIFTDAEPWFFYPIPSGVAFIYILFAQLRKEKPVKSAKPK